MIGELRMNKMNVNNINRKTLIDVVHTPESMDALQTYILQTKGLSATLASLMMYNLMATEFNTLLDTVVNAGDA